ncbi:hypothetical protein KVV02_007498 [Mortierella alpina]|uniref:FAM192A/Fyv6 N-terminal domain-containing protein n=1 Tax=Mortierella alpina TaxID=64518 RepID=A0A9P8AAQ8_MORAP|nr:hypothetical protein KVV02_007498 [Mortierella alpina]
MDHSEQAAQGLGPFISYVLGWTYFIAWSASFYPQAILNWRRKSVQGLSLDYIYLNVLGFLCYSIFNVSFFFSSEIQDEYRRRNHGKENLVRANDIFFALHALILSTFTLLQTWVYKRQESHEKVSLWAKLYIVTAVVIAVVLAGQAAFGKQGREWIDVLYYLSTVKLVISFLKYCPQVYINWHAKSTVGWSIHNILLDFTGGLLSIAQLVLDASIAGDWTGISGDLVKFGLGFLSIAFDLIFMAQHYILYRDRTDYYAPMQAIDKMEGGERQGLLQPETRDYQATNATNDLEASHSIEEARKERQEEWKKAYDNKENPPPIQEEVPYDPRTLYERLQEQKQKKDDAFAEATKFGNLIHRIDNDEFDFLSTLENEEAQKKRELAEQEEEELRKFRMNVQLKTAPAPSQSLINSSTPLGAASGSSLPGLFTGTVAPKKKSSLFAGLVKRDNSSTSKSSASDSGVERASSKSKEPTADASKAGGKRKADEAPETTDKHGSTIEAKKSKLAPSAAPSSTKKPNALLSLVAYDSSSDDEGDV